MQLLEKIYTILDMVDSETEPLQIVRHRHKAVLISEHLWQTVQTNRDILSSDSENK